MIISLDCGTAVPTPLTPLMKMPSWFSSTMRAVARSGASVSGAVPEARER
jgi:hypothetical protein